MLNGRHARPLRRLAVRCRACFAKLQRQLSLADAMQVAVWACAALMALTTLGILVAIRSGSSSSNSSSSGAGGAGAAPAD